MSEFTRKILKVDFKVNEYVIKERSFKNHSVQTVERRITKSYFLECGHVAPISAFPLTKKERKTCVCINCKYNWGSE